MRKTIIISLILLIGLTEFSYGQDRKASKIGFGVNYYSGPRNLVAIPEGLGSIYISETFANNFRLEPEFGYFSYSHGNGENYKYSSTSMRIGLGQFYVSQPKKSVSYFVGPRFGVIFNWQSEDTPYSDVSEESATDIYISLCTGAEYYLSEHFSLGGEIQLGYINYGKYESDYDDESLMYHNALFTLRWYY